MDFYHDGLTAFATQSLSGFSTDHTGVSDFKSKPRAITVPEYTVCFAWFLAKIKYHIIVKEMSSIKLVKEKKQTE